MLATPQEDAAAAAQTLFAGRTFWAEDKLDGIGEHHKFGQRIAIYTRTMDRVDKSFPDVVTRLPTSPAIFCSMGNRPLARRASVAVRPSAKTPWPQTPTHAMLRDNPLAYIAFDLLYLDGRLLIDDSLRHTPRIAGESLSSRQDDHHEHG